MVFSAVAHATEGDLEILATPPVPGDGESLTIQVTLPETGSGNPVALFWGNALSPAGDQIQNPRLVDFGHTDAEGIFSYSQTLPDPFDGNHFVIAYALFEGEILQSCPLRISASDPAGDFPYSFPAAMQNHRWKGGWLSFGYEVLRDPNPEGLGGANANYHPLKKDSPDGRWVAFRHATSSGPTIAVALWDWTARTRENLTTPGGNVVTKQPYWSDHLSHPSASDPNEPVLVFRANDGPRTLWRWTPTLGQHEVGPGIGGSPSHIEAVTYPTEEEPFGRAIGSASNSGPEWSRYRWVDLNGDETSNEIWLDNPAGQRWDNLSYWRDPATGLEYCAIKDRNSGGNGAISLFDGNGNLINMVCNAGNSSGGNHFAIDSAGILWRQRFDNYHAGIEIAVPFSTNHVDYEPAQYLPRINHQTWNDIGRIDAFQCGDSPIWTGTKGRRGYMCYDVASMRANPGTAIGYRLFPNFGGPMLGSGDAGTEFDADVTGSRDFTKCYGLASYDPAGPAATAIYHSALTRKRAGSETTTTAATQRIYIADGSAAAFAGVEEFNVGDLASNHRQVSSILVGSAGFQDGVMFDGVSYTAIDASGPNDDHGTSQHDYNAARNAPLITETRRWLREDPHGSLTLATEPGVSFSHRRPAFVCWYVRVPDNPYLEVNGDQLDLYPGIHHQEIARHLLFRLDATTGSWVEEGVFKQFNYETKNWDDGNVPIQDFAGQTIAVVSEEWSGLRSWRSNILVLPLMEGVHLREDQHPAQVVNEPGWRPPGSH